MRESGFVGRLTELGKVESGLGRAVDGRGGILLVTGDPGIGKTRLAREAADMAASRDIRVLWGRCWEGGGAPAFWPWIEVLREYAREVDDASLRADVGAHAPRIASLLPELRDRLDATPEPLAENEFGKFLMFDAVAHTLKSMAGVGPLLVIIDDLHSADVSTLHLLQFLADRIDHISLFVLGAFRSSEPDLQPRNRELIGQIATRAELITLTGLGSDETEQFVEALAGQEVPEDFVQTIHEKTAGNPLFLDEVLRTLGPLPDISDVTAVSIRIPNHLRDQIRRRLEVLSDGLLTALGAASVIGRSFDLEMLARITQLEESDLIHHLELAEKAGVVNALSLSNYSFSHVLFQETLSEQLSASVRINLHVRVAEALEVERDPRLVAARIASHYVILMGAGYSSRARLWSRRAGEVALASFAFDEAVYHFEEALKTQEHELVPPEEVAELTLLLGRALRAAGDQTARVTLAEAVEVARQASLPLHLARAVLEFTPRMGFINPGDREMPELVEEALDLLGDADSELRAWLLCRWCSLLAYYPDKADQRRQKLEEAKALAETMDAPVLRSAVALAEVSVNDRPPGPTDLDRSHTLVEIAEASADRELILDAQSELIYRTLQRGERTSAQQLIRAYARMAEETKSAFHRWCYRMMDACDCLVEGDFEKSIALSDEALQIGMAAPIYDPFAYWAALRGNAWLVMRDPDWFGPSLPAMEEGLKQFPALVLSRLGFVHFHSYLGDLDEAQRWFEPLGPEPVTSLRRDQRWLPTMTVFGEIAFHMNLPEMGEQVARDLEPYAGYVAYITRGATIWGIPAMSIGTSAAAAGLDDLAETNFEKAIRLTATVGARPHQGHSHFYYGWFLLKRGDAQRARTHLSRARAIYDNLGMSYPSSRAQKLLDPLESAAPVEHGEAVLAMEGDVWKVGIDGRMFRLKDVKGLRYLARLISQPDREIAALDLVAVGSAGVSGFDPDDALVAGELDPGLEVIDAAARRAYTQRIKELQADIDEAQDPGLRERYQEEMDALVAALTGAFGKGGRVRKTSSAAEKARLSVTRAMRAAIDKIQQNDPVLGKHLAVSIRTGTFCSYAPDASSRIKWRISA